MNAIGLSYFDGLYAGNDDPWAMRTRWYEQRKRALVLASLPARTYACVFEPGCGSGDLTLELAPRCEQLLASDFSSDAVRITRARLAAHTQVTVQRATMPDQWPSGPFDLIIFSEFGFYLDDAQLLALQQRALATLTATGTLLAVHWRHPFAERTQDTETIHEWFERQPGLTRIVHHEEADFLLDVWSRVPASVARQEGLT